jgi:MFS family permease
MANAKSDAPASLWQPLRSSTFRNLLVADVVSDVGTFMQSVGAAWLMVSLNAGPMYVALTQTASALPFFILALPAGAIGDIVDRRKVILRTETWMVIVAAVLAAMTIAGKMSPVLLLVLTFALWAGDAFETPTWRAVLPELVSKEDLQAASALNGIEFNFARAVGPALAGHRYRTETLKDGREEKPEGLEPTLERNRVRNRRRTTQAWPLCVPQPDDRGPV